MPRGSSVARTGATEDLPDAAYGAAMMRCQFFGTRDVNTYLSAHLWTTCTGREAMIVDDNSERLLTPGEVAALFRVDPKTVTRWAASGRISSIRTPGGHRRFRESEVHALLRGEGQGAR